MPTPEFPAVAIVLVNYKGWRETIECIDTVLAQAYPNYHVFVVDNDSGDQSVERIAAWCDAPRRDAGWRDFAGVHRVSAIPGTDRLHYRIARREDGVLPVAATAARLTVVHAGANLGFAGGCNVGIAAAGRSHFDYFWLLNTDTVVDAGALSALVARASADPAVGMVGSTIRLYFRPLEIQALAGARVSRRMLVTRQIGEGRAFGGPLPAAENVERDLAYIAGASMLVSRRFVAEVGPMQEDYFLYYEEFDWALRGAGRFRLAYAPASQVFHKVGATSARALRDFSMQLRYRNLVRFASRFFPERLGLVRLDLLRTLLRYIAEGRWRGIRIVAGTLRDFDALASSVAPAAVPPPAGGAAASPPLPLALRVRRGA